MKKVMIAAAAVSLAAAVQAGFVVNTNCNPRSTTCPVAAFKVTANGKIAAPVEKGDEVYKTTSKLSIKKGALVLFPTQAPYSTDPDDCCVEAFSFYLQVKVGKDTVPVGIFYQPIDSWSIYGKAYGKVLDAYATKSKKASVESELGLAYAVNNGAAASTINTAGTQSSSGYADTVTDTGTGVFDFELGLDDFAFIATAFGKGKYKYTYKTGKDKSTCIVCTLEDKVEFVPGNYAGWFAGLVTDLGGDFGCLLCNCANLDVFGGTWKAKYDKKWSATAEGWQKAASYVFGSAALAAMKVDPADPDSWIE